MKVFGRTVTRLAVLLSCAGMLAGSFGVSAQAQSYPDRSIRLVVGFAAGGGSDAVARLIASGLGEKLGQSVVVENRPGANTIIATQYVKGQPADGYTLLYTSASFVINPALQAVSYDVKKDFVPVALINSIPLLLVTNNQVPASNIEELVAYAKSQPNRLSYASFGVGSAAHLAAEQFLAKTGLDMLHVPYKGSAPGLVDVMGGQVTMMMPGIGSAVALVKEGKLRAIAVSSAKRASVMPDVPTIAESGVDGYEIVTWETIQAPTGTPPDVVARLNVAIGEVLASPEIREKMIKLGVEPESAKSPQEVAAFMDREAEKFAAIIRERRIQVQ